MRKILSHPNKDLHIHLNGVLQKINRRGFTNIISNFVSPNHDIAKINENFQNMFNGIFSGYRDHSYLSAYISLYIIFKNKQLKDKILNENILFINIISNIIASHHGYIKNITEIFDDEQLEKLKNFLESDTKLPFEDFIKEHYKDIIYDDFIFDRRYNKKIIDYASNKKYVSLWGENAIKYYYDTIFNFAQLIEADKRDASDNENYEILENIKNYNYTFDNNLNLYLSKLKSNSELNLKRLEIRNDAEKNLLNNLKTNNRMFELTAPTGSGKTFMMLKLANIIQQEKGDYGIIMSLPFTSIIDQTADICETDILLNCLNYTSVSNTTHELNKLINELDNNYNSINLKNLISCNFSEETFDHPFVITTFIQFFQTLISNKNNVAIKLPNFTKRIFLIDEFQSLPSSLYTFFYGILQYFCETYDCYCVLSTATMPNFNLNNKRIINNIRAYDIFKNYKKPISLLNSEKYYSSSVFNRYTIDNIGDKGLDELVINIDTELKYNSVLVIMNTVKDSYDVFDNIEFDNKYILNGHLSVNHKLNIINSVKEDLKNNIKVLLISTQIVEAGVDIDFPIVFRDLCPLPFLIQSSGRCNRNNKYIMGFVKLFNYYKISQKNTKYYSSNSIYDSYDTSFVKNKISKITESKLFELQKEYYNLISEYKTIGRVSNELNLLKELYLGNLETLGNYTLIDSKENEYVYYIGEDKLWNEFKIIYESKPNTKKFHDYKLYKIKLSIISKKIQKFCLNILLKKNDIQIPYSDEIMGIRKISDKTLYHEQKGLDENNFNIRFI